MSKRLLLHFALLLWWVVPTQAQLALTLPNLTAQKGDQIEIDLSVDDYDDLYLCQFTVRWNPAILHFVELSEIGLADQNDLLLNLNDSLSGFFRFLYINQAFNGQTLDDGSALVKMKFNVIGEPGDTSTLEISDDPLPFLAAGGGSTDPIQLFETMARLSSIYLMASMIPP